MMIEKIFKAYDVRATYPNPLNEETAWKVGHATAQYLKRSRQTLAADQKATWLYRADIPTIRAPGRSRELLLPKVHRDRGRRGLRQSEDIFHEMHAGKKS